VLHTAQFTGIRKSKSAGRAQAALIPRLNNRAQPSSGILALHVAQHRFAKHCTVASTDHAWIHAETDIHKQRIFNELRHSRRRPGATEPDNCIRVSSGEDVITV
jgi:hypothetical protein